MAFWEKPSKVSISPPSLVGQRAQVLPGTSLSGSFVLALHVENWGATETAHSRGKGPE